MAALRVSVLFAVIASSTSSQLDTHTPSTICVISALAMWISAFFLVMDWQTPYIVSESQEVIVVLIESSVHQGWPTPSVLSLMAVAAAGNIGKCFIGINE